MFLYLLLVAVAHATVPLVERATCVFTRGGAVSGHVSFTRGKTDTTCTIAYSLTGLSVGSHKWHVHLYGDISMDSTMKSTGGHYVGKPTGGRTEIANFATPSITADAQGSALLTFEDAQIKLYGENSILGRSIVIHGDSPTNTGVRVAMCVVGIAQERLDEQIATPVTALESDKRTLTSRISGKRVVSTQGPVVKYVGYDDDRSFQGTARVTEKPAGLVKSLTELGTVLNEAGEARVPAGTVTVIETIDGAGERKVQLRYVLKWGAGQTIRPTPGGIHIHDGTSCTSGQEGGHYYSVANDPWNTVWAQPIKTTLGTSWHSSGTTDIRFTGLTLDDYIGKVVVVHDSKGKVACGLITAAPALKVSLDLHSLGSQVFSYHIHQGGSCTPPPSSDNGHYYDPTVLQVDPWIIVPITPYSLGLGAGKGYVGTDTLCTGFTLKTGGGLVTPRTIVFHDENMKRAGCVELFKENDVGGESQRAPTVKLNRWDTSPPI